VATPIAMPIAITMDNLGAGELSWAGDGTDDRIAMLFLLIPNGFRNLGKGPSNETTGRSCSKENRKRTQGHRTNPKQGKNQFDNRCSDCCFEGGNHRCTQNTSNGNLRHVARELSRSLIISNPHPPQKSAPCSTFGTRDSWHLGCQTGRFWMVNPDNLIQTGSVSV